MDNLMLLLSAHHQIIKSSNRIYVTAEKNKAPENAERPDEG